jgi:hypothetical protein
VHILVTAAIRIRHITNALIALISANLRDRLSSYFPKHAQPDDWAYHEQTRQSPGIEA